MGPIKNIFGLSQEIQKADKGKEPKRVKSDDRRHPAAGKSGSVKGSKDKAEISSVGRELLTLQMEAEKYIDHVHHVETLSSREIESIKEKIAANYYFDPEVIDKVVDKLIAMPNFNRII